MRWEGETAIEHDLGASQLGASLSSSGTGMRPSLGSFGTWAGD